MNKHVLTEKEERTLTTAFILAWDEVQNCKSFSLFNFIMLNVFGRSALSFLRHIAKPLPPSCHKTLP